MEQLLAQLPVYLLVVSRLGGLMLVSPIFANRAVPPQVRAALSFILGLLILPRATAAPGVTEGAGLLVGAVLEMLTGMIVGFFTQLVLAALQMAGALMDMDIGFAMVQIFDPVSGRPEPVLGTFFQTLALVVFLALDAHHWVIRALAESYTYVPAGGLTLGVAGPMYVVEYFGALLSLAVQLVLPFLAVMLLTTVALAGVNRAVSQLNIFTLGLAMKVLIGLAGLMLLLPYILPRMSAIFATGYTELLRTLDLFKQGL